MSSSVARVRIFLCHQGEMQTAPPTIGSVEFSPLDLRKLRPSESWDFDFARLAEARAFATQDLPELTGLTHVGFMSWRMPQKRNDGISWESLGTTAGNLSPRTALAPFYWPTPTMGLAEQANLSFPGMGSLVHDLDKLKSAHNLTCSPASMQVGANSFVVPLSAYSRFLSFTRQILRWRVWRQPDAPFRFRCSTCGVESSHKIGRYGVDRDMALFLEHSTIYFFQRSCLNIEFSPVSGSWQGHARLAYRRGRHRLRRAFGGEVCIH